MRVEGKMRVDGPLGSTSPLALLVSRTVTAWLGPFTIPIVAGLNEQAIVVLGTQGLTTVTALLITADADISVTYGVAANNVPIPLNANGFHLLADTSLTAITITTAASVTANLTYFLGGS